MLLDIKIVYAKEERKRKKIKYKDGKDDRYYKNGHFLYYYVTARKILSAS